MKEKTNFKKNFIWNVLGTGFSAFNSLFFMIIVTRINQIEEAGIFTLAFSTACIFYIIGTYVGRIYQVTENNKNISDKDYLMNRAISCILMMILTAIFVFIRGYDSYKIIIFLLLAFFKCIEAFTDCIYGIFQKNDKLYKVGQSYFIKSVLSVAIFYVVDKLTNNLVLSILSIIGVWMIITLLFDILGVKGLIDKKVKTNFSNVFNIFKKSFPVFIITFLGVYMTNAQKYAIDGVLSDDIQAIFGIIIMPATVMGLLAQFLIHPYLNEIFELYKDNNYKQIKKILYKIILIIFGIGLACSVLGYFLGAPVLGLIYSINLTPYSIHLAIILIAATLYTMAGIISPVLITMRHTTIQFFIYITVSLFELCLSNILVANYGFNGAVWAYLITMTFFFGIFFFVAIRIINKKDKIINKKGEQ